MNDLLAPVSKCICHSVPSNTFPILLPCSDIGNFSSAFILADLVISIPPMYVLPYYECFIKLCSIQYFDLTPLSISKTSLISLGVSPKSTSI